MLQVTFNAPGESLQDIHTGPVSSEDAYQSDLDHSRTASRTGQNTISPDSLPYTFNHIEDLGDWPQRLLHVPSLTSYEWTPGNVYNGVKAPIYNAISYTWGRFRLNDGQLPEIGPALDIRGTPWEIPRINPSHFTSAQMAAVVTMLSEIPAPKHVANVVTGSETALLTTPFLWLDLACIDQRGGPVAAMEIGRQGGIFRRAARVGVWLSRSVGDDDRHESFQEFFRIARSRDMDLGFRSLQDHKLARLLSCVHEVLSDPWFSSLWTLQEAYLGDGLGMALIGGLANALTWGDDPRPVNLSDLRKIARVSSHLRQRDGLQPEVRQLLDEVDALYEASGLQSLTDMRFERELLACARHRTTTYERDRVYGIMQVFGYRLGASKPGCEGNDYTLEELLDQLGAALLSHYPIESQLYVLRSPAETGKAWRIGMDTAVPKSFRNFGTVMGRAVVDAIDRGYSVETTYEADAEPVPRLSTQKVGGFLYGKFEGRICPWNVLWPVWTTMNEHGHIKSALAALRMGKSAVHFYPDATVVLPHFPFPGNHGVDDTVEAQQEYGRSLQVAFDRARLVVLYLATEKVNPLANPGRFQRYYGLLLVHVFDKDRRGYYWHRLGVATWNYDTQDVHKYDVHLPSGWRDLLSATSEDWTTAIGLYG